MLDDTRDRVIANETALPLIKAELEHEIKVLRDELERENEALLERIEKAEEKLVYYDRIAIKYGTIAIAVVCIGAYLSAATDKAKEAIIKFIHAFFL